VQLRGKKLNFIKSCEVYNGNLLSGLSIPKSMEAGAGYISFRVAQ